MLKRLTGLFILFILVLLPSAAFARDPVVYAVLFFSPQCPHCHYVIEEHLPRWRQEFGNQLKLLMVDVTTEQGGELFQAASLTPGIQITSFGVPTLVIGKDVLVGSVDIPEQMPGRIRNGLGIGGIELPPIPGLREAYAEDLATEDVTGASAEPSIVQRIAADPVANSLSVGVLILLMLSAVAVLAANGLIALKTWLQGKPTWIFSLVVSLAATFLASTLVVRAHGDTLLLSGGVTLALIVETVGIGIQWRTARWSGSQSNWLLPLTALVGLAIAAYLAGIEVSQSEAVCGLIGDCNAVQQSPYARLFGMLPIGILGVVGYICILLAWFVSRKGNMRFARLTQPALRAMVLFGVVFSIYLTFLEPFVIGATCIWCLTSAVIMLLLLWLTVPDAQHTAATAHR